MLQQENFLLFQRRVFRLWGFPVLLAHELSLELKLPLSCSAGTPVVAHGNLKGIVKTWRNSFPSLSSAEAARNIFIMWIHPLEAKAGTIDSS